MIPFDGGQKINYTCFILNIVLSFFFLNEIMKLVDEQFQMQEYLFTRTSKSKAICRSLLFVSKKIAFIFLVKILVDLLFSRADWLVNLDRFLWMEASTMITLLLWAVIGYFLMIRHMNIKIITMLLTVVNLLLVYISAIAPAAATFIIASPHFFEHPFLFSLIKVLLIVIIYWFLFISLKTYEVIRERSK